MTGARNVFAAALAVVLLLWSAAAAQQTGLTDAQIKTAGIEVPRLIELLELKPGMTVADVGAGFGAWTMGFARALGPSGRVYATDVGAAQLAALRDIGARERLSNVTVIEGAVESTNLPALCCDAILVRDAFHHFTRPEAMISSLAASLKPGGRLAVIDFPPRPNSEVPSGVPANRGGHGVPPEVVEREIGAALPHVRTIPDWSSSSQPASLFLVLFRKP
jgi:cyclopropane fatty-acyl-phospholipid synthase-like methyltransferase